MALLRPVASLPLAVFFQLGTPFPEVQQRAYASALVLDDHRAGDQPGIALAGAAVVEECGEVIPSPRPIARAWGRFGRR